MRIIITRFILVGSLACVFRSALVVGLASCTPATNAGRVTIDCIAADQAQLEALILQFTRELVSGAPDWSVIEQEAIKAGHTIGGCALAHVVQEYLTPAPGRMAVPAESGRTARATLERFRAEQVGGAVFHSREGDL